MSVSSNDNWKFTTGAKHFAWASLAVPNEENVLDPPNTKWDVAKKMIENRMHILLDIPEEHIHLFHNTSAGVQRILLRLSQLLKSPEASFLTTDFEYPGIIAALDDAWSGPVYIAQCESLIWNKRASIVTDLLKNAFLLTRPSMFYVSHVSRGAGYVIPEELLTFVRQISPKTIIIVDGAQAVGNIHVTRSFLAKTDFYITSGHKWLGGKQTIGIVIAKPKWNVPDPGQSYTRKIGSAGTGDKESLASMAEVLKYFLDKKTMTQSRMKRIASQTKSISKHFITLLKAKDVGDIDIVAEQKDWEYSGIVSIKCGIQLLSNVGDIFDITVDQAKPDDPRITVLDREQWRGAEGSESAGDRYYVTFTDGSNKPDIQRIHDLSKEYVPIPDGLCLRICFHNLAHTNLSVQLIVDLL